MDNRHVEVVQNSFGRALLAGDLIEKFYDIFLNEHPKVKPLFEDTNFNNQKELLRHGINLMIMFASDSTFGNTGIKRIAKTHSAAGMNIPLELYIHWENSLYKALNELDPKFDADVKECWKHVVKKGTNFIKSHHQANRAA